MAQNQNRDLNATVKFSVAESISSLKSVRKELESIDKLIQGFKNFKLPTSVGGSSSGGSIPKPPPPPVSKPDLTTLKEYREGLALAKTQSILLGREIDAQRKKLDDGTRSYKQINDELKSNQKLAGLTQTATSSLAKAEDKLHQSFKDGLISLSQYKKGLIDIAAQKKLLDNRLNDATPIRRLGSNLESVISTINPKLGSILGQIKSVKQALGEGLGGFGNFNASPAIRNKVSSIPEAVGNVIPIRGKGAGSLAIGGAEAAAGIEGAGLAAGAATLAIAGAAVAVTALSAAFVKVGSDALNAAKSLEESQYAMAALINSTTQFYDQTGKKLGIEENLKASLSKGKELIAQFQNDAAKLSLIETSDLVAGAQTGLAFLPKLGITGVKEQAEAIETLVGSLKLLKPAAKDAEIAFELRTILQGDFSKSQSDLARFAQTTGLSAKELEKQYAAAVKAGQGLEFLRKTFGGLFQGIKFAESTLGNQISIFSDLSTRALQTIGEKFLTPLKGLVKEAYQGLAGQADTQFSKPTIAAFSAIGRGFASFIENVKSFVQPLIQLGILTGQLFGGLITVINSIYRPFSQFFAGLIAGFNALIQPIVSIISFISQIVGLVSDGISSIVGKFQISDFLTKPFVDLLSTITNVFNQATAFVAGFREDTVKGMEVIRQAFQFSWLAVAGYVKIGLGKGILAVVDFVNNFQSIFSNIPKFTAGVFISTAQSIASIFLQLSQKAKETGKAIVDGLTGKGFKAPSLEFKLPSFKIPKIDISKTANNLIASGQADLAKANLTKNSLQSNFGSLVGLGKSSQPLKETSKGKFAGEEDAGKKKKGKDKDPAIAERRLADALAELEKQRELNKAKEEELAIEREFLRLKAQEASLEISSDKYKETLNNNKALLEIEKDKLARNEKQIDFLLKTKKITQEQAIELKRQNSIAEIQKQYQIDYIEYEGKKQAAIDETNKAIFNEAERQKNIKVANTEVKGLDGAISAKEDLLKNEAIKADKAKVAQETKLLEELIIKRKEAQLALDKVISESKIGTEKDLFKISKAENEAANFKQSITTKRDNAIGAANQDAGFAQGEELQKRTEQIQKALKDGGKAIFDEITNAFEDGKISIQEAFKIAETIFSKVQDVFKAINSGGGGGNILGSLLPNFKFGGGGSAAGSNNNGTNAIEKIGNGNFGLFNSQTGAFIKDLGTQCGVSAKEMAGLGQQTNGLGGIFGGLGNAVGSAIQGLGGLVSKIPGIGGALGGVLNNVGGFLKGGAGAVQGAAGAAGGLGGLTSAAGGAGGAASANPIGAGVMAAFTVATTAFSLFQGFKAKKKAKKEAKIQKEVDEFKKQFDDIQKNLDKADDLFLKDTLVGISTRIRARRKAMADILAKYNALSYTAKGRVLAETNEAREKLSKEIKDLTIELGQKFADFENRVFLTGFDREFRKLGEAVDDALKEAADLLEGGFDKDGVGKILNDSIKGIGEEYFKPLDDAIFQATQDRKSLFKELANQAVEDLKALTESISQTLEQFGFKKEETADSKIQRLIKDFNNEAARKKEERIQAELDAEKKIADAQDKRTQAQKVFDEAFASSQKNNLARLTNGSESYFTNLGTKNLIMNDKIDNLVNAFQSAVSSGVAENLDLIAKKIS